MLKAQFRNSSLTRCGVLSSLRALVMITAAMVAPQAHAAGIPIYGGPAYSSATSTGYRGNSGHSQFLAIDVNNAGTVVGTGSKTIAGVGQGFRGLQWGATQSGVTEFQAGNTIDGYRGYASLINDAGTVAGSAIKYTSGVASTAILQWNAAGTPTELQNLPNDGTFYYSPSLGGMNGAGTIVGTDTKFVYIGSGGGAQSTTSSAVRWDAATGAITRLGNLGLPETGSTGALAINSTGTTVGYSTDVTNGGGQSFAVKWEATGLSPIPLPNPGTGATYYGTRAEGINDNGIIVGNTQRYTSNGGNINGWGGRAVLWDLAGNPIELGNLGTSNNSFDGYTNTHASAINAAATIVGYADKWVNGVNIGTRAVRWDADSPSAVQLGDLGTNSTAGVEGSTTAYAYDINAAGISVGQAAKYVAGVYQGLRAVAWSADGTAIDLNTLIDPDSGWLLTNAYKITDTGWMIGVGTFTPGGADAPYERAFLMNINAPEPSTWLLAAIAVLSLALGRRAIGPALTHTPTGGDVRSNSVQN